MSYPYPPTGPGEQPPGGRPGGWGAPPPPGGYGPSGPGWQHQETMAGGVPMGPPQMMPPHAPPPMGRPPMGPMGPMGQPPMGPPPKKGNGGVVIGAIVGAVVLVGGVLGGAYYAASSGGNDENTGTTPAAVGTPGTGQPGVGRPGSVAGQAKPSSYNATKSWSLWKNLNTAAQDARPMSLDEVFSDADAKAQSNSIEHITMQLQGNGRLDTDCASTVWGSALKTALQGYGCTQAIRAAYVSSDQHWIGQLVIYNLRDVHSANMLIQDLDPEAGDKGFFLPVSGPSPVDRFGKGSTSASGGACGHFVVIGWSSDAGGSTTSTGTIAPASLTERAGKTFLFSRNVRN